jgi:hypothetical protein
MTFGKSFFLPWIAVFSSLKYELGLEVSKPGCKSVTSREALEIQIPKSHSRPTELESLGPEHWGPVFLGSSPKRF